MLAYCEEQLRISDLSMLLWDLDSSFALQISILEDSSFCLYGSENVFKGSSSETIALQVFWQGWVDVRVTDSFCIKFQPDFSIELSLLETKDNFTEHNTVPTNKEHCASSKRHFFFQMVQQFIIRFLLDSAFKVDFWPKGAQEYPCPSGSKPWKTLEGQTGERSSHFFAHTSRPSSCPQS